MDRWKGLILYFIFCYSGLWLYLVIVLPTDGVWRLGAESDDAGQIDGTAHANEDFTATQDCRTRLYINDNNRR